MTRWRPRRRRAARARRRQAHRLAGWSKWWAFRAESRAQSLDNLLDVENVHRFGEGIEAHEIVLTPLPGRTGDEVGHLVRGARRDAERGTVDVNGRLPDGVRVDVRDDEDR